MEHFFVDSTRKPDDRLFSPTSPKSLGILACLLFRWLLALFSGDALACHSVSTSVVSTLAARMTFLRAAWLCALLIPLVKCVVNDPFDLGHVPYTPVCGHTCRLAIQEDLLECTSNETKSTAPGCYASNTPYLTTLAYCLSTRCESEPVARLNAFWARYTIGTSSPEPSPQLSYKTALRKAGTPNETVNPGTLLAQTALVPDEVYQFQLKELESWNEAEDTHSKAAYVDMMPTPKPC